MKEIRETLEFEEFEKYIHSEEDGNVETGVIKLPVKVVDVRLWRNDFAPLCLVLGKTPKEIGGLAGYTKALVTKDSEDGKYKAGQIIEMKEAEALKDTISGGEAVQALFDKIDLKDVWDRARTKEQECMAQIQAYQDAHDTDEITDITDDEEAIKEAERYESINSELWKARKTLDACLFLKKTGKKVTTDTIKMFPKSVIGLLKQASEEKLYDTSYGILYLYNRIIAESGRLRMLMDIKAPEIILRNEKHRLQSYFESLIGGDIYETASAGHYENGLKGYTPLPSLAGIITDTIKLY